MPFDSTQNQSPTHHHAHDHSHAHVHSHNHSQGAGSAYAPQQTSDLKSPVLIGVLQRLFWTGVMLAGLWLVVFWALRTHG